MKRSLLESVISLALPTRALLCLFAALSLNACTTVSGSAAPLTARGFAPTNKGVHINTVSVIPPGLQMLGLVQARGVGKEATVDKVLPELVRQAQRLGATHLVVDDLHVDYHSYASMMPYSHQCGFQGCLDLGVNANEVAVLEARGRAFAQEGTVSSQGGSKP